jgi:hypothetical protein
MWLFQIIIFYYNYIMSNKYSSKFIEFVKDVLYKYNGYVVKSDDKKVLVKYDPGFGSQYASIPSDLYNSLEKKSLKKNLPIKKSISQEIPDIIKNYKEDKAKREKKIQKKEEKRMEIETTIKGVPFLKKEREMKLFKNAMYRKLFYLHKIPITQSTVKFLTEQTWELVEKKLNLLIMKNSQVSRWIQYLSQTKSFRLRRKAILLIHIASRQYQNI